jgi:hypothetical protein
MMMMIMMKIAGRQAARCSSLSTSSTAATSTRPA